MWRAGRKYLYLWHVLNEKTWSVVLRIVSQLKWATSLFYCSAMLTYVKITKSLKFCMEFRAHFLVTRTKPQSLIMCRIKGSKRTEENECIFYTSLVWLGHEEKLQFFVLVMGQYRKWLSKLCSPTCEIGAFEILWSYRIILVYSLENFLVYNSLGSFSGSELLM